MALQKFTVSRDNAVYHGWPDLIQTEKGKLICVFSECRHHLNRDQARIVIVESTDRGRTWSEKKALTEKGRADLFFNCARISRMNDGRLAIICDKIYGTENDKAEMYVWYSDSEGTDWGEPTVYPFCGIVPDKLLQLKNGRMIIAAHFRGEVSQMAEQYMWYSDDNGQTWSDRIVIAADPRYNLCEVSILECENNTLVAFMRENSLKGYPVIKAYSFDNGETWSEIHDTGIDSGHRPVSGFLQDGSVMVTYRYIPRFDNNVFAAIMEKDDLLVDDRKKQRIRVFPLDFDRNPHPDCGYTGWTQFEDGEIYVVNYIKDDAQKAYIRGYSFYKEDYILPEGDINSENYEYDRRFGTV